MSFTTQQELAITATGNTIVVAGAGAGKTRTLVERCIRMITGEQRVPVKNVLVVTFTEAAAAEVRERIRQRLEAEFEKNPGDVWLQEQVALLDSAPINTLHGFCYGLVREHFNELGLDPAVSVISAEQATLLRVQQFEAMLMEHYRGEHDFSHQVQELIRDRFDGWDKRLRDLVFKLHTFTETRPDPAGWLRAQQQLLAEPQATQWREWYEQALRDWCLWWAPFLCTLPESNQNAHACAALLQAATAQGNPLPAPAQILEREKAFPKGKRGEFSAPFKSLFTEAKFLASLQDHDGRQPLQEDWEWVRQPLHTLLRVAQQFRQRYEEARRERSALDFHDLEQYALKLLWDDQAQEPKPLATEWQNRFEAIFVDEYQDINAAQDLILTALSRKGVGNRFLVGDIKQSIYRFRQADPGIFRSYLKAADRAEWQKAVLSENFRSHEGVLAFINPLFAEIMQENFGGVAYDQEAELRFGDREQRAHLTTAADSSPAVEVHLLSDQAAVENVDGEEDSPELDDTEEEARLIARRLLELKQLFQIPADSHISRPANWSDMVVLLRGVKNKVETFAKVFHEFGVPLEAKRNAFYSTQEVMDLVSVLQILDNPLQDVPLLAVLRSPLAGLGVNDLATIRIGREKIDFWHALTLFHERKGQSEPWLKVDKFLSKYHRWRRSSRCMSLCHRLEMILTDTGYGEWIQAQERGRQRYANIQQLLRIAREFDDARGENLYLFLRHIEETQEAAGDIEPAPLGESDAVRIMSVHQSKGLEFPIVVLAGLGTNFNQQDTHQSILLDEQYGICAHVKPPGLGARYSGLTHWLAARRQKAESLAEEMRILYVALTRARQRLLLFGAVPKARPERWAKQAAHPAAPLMPHQLLKAQNWLDWIGPHLARRPSDFLNQSEGRADTWNYRWHETVPQPALGSKSAEPRALDLHSPEIASLRDRLVWNYPQIAATLLPAKTTATSLSRRAGEIESDEDSPPPILNLPRADDNLERGTASHIFLERMTLTPGLTTANLQKEGRQFVQDRILTQAQLDLVDLDAIASFWNSPLGREIISHPSRIRRELPFTARLDAASLKRFRLAHLLAIPEGEFIVVQGIADLVLLLDSEIWLVDFKTGEVRRKELRGKIETYRPQMEVYSLALEAIYRRPVKRRFLHFLAANKSEEIEALLL